MKCPRPVLQARDSGQAGHLQPEPGRVLQVHGDQGGEQPEWPGGVLSPCGHGV